MLIPSAILAESWWDRNQTLAGIIIGVAATVIVGAVVYRMQRQKKTLDWEILTDEPINTGAVELDIHVTFGKDCELREPRIITVRLANTGKSEIRPGDFDGPIIIRTAPWLTIKTASTIRTARTMRHTPSCRWDKNKCSIESVLFNRDDWIDVQLLLDSAENIDDDSSPVALDDVDVESVIAGQTRPGRQFKRRADVIRLTLVEILAQSIASIVRK